MKTNSLQQIVGNTDIYLLDQIMKGRYLHGDILLDAGCGAGRNLHWFIHNGITVYGIDIDPLSIESLRTQNSSLSADRFRVSTVESIPFPSHFFDHIISSAVLHFAKNTHHFNQMIAEMTRLLKPGGSLFIRMTSDIGIEKKVQLMAEGVYSIPDGSTRFLLTRKLLSELLSDYPLQMMEPLKSTIVDDIRSMSTLVMQKI